MNNGITNKDDILKAVVARQNYQKKHNDTITDKQLIDLAVFSQGIGDDTWGDPEKREKLLQGLNDRGISPDEVKRTESLINAMKK